MSLTETVGRRSLRQGVASLNAVRGVSTAQFRVPGRTAGLGGSPELQVWAGFTSKAGDRIRTDDIHVGNVTLYH